MNKISSLLNSKFIAVVGASDTTETFREALSTIADVSFFGNENEFFTNLLVEKEVPDLCFIDMKRDGRKLKYQLLNSLRTIKVPVIGLLDENDELGVELKTLSYGAVDVIRKPYTKEIIKTKADFIFQKSFVESILIQKPSNCSAIEESNEMLRSLMYQTLAALSSSIDAKDSYTRGHSSRVALFSSILGKTYGLSLEDLNALHHSALMHDVGKIGMPDAVLRKPGRLSKDEKEIIQKHPVIGFEILKSINLMPDMALVARYHHERWDGSGYPDNLSGKDIPLFARITSLADSLDAMTSNRSYRHPLTFMEARDEILKCSGTQFDPYLAEMAAGLIENYVVEKRIPDFTDIFPSNEQ